MRRRLVFSLYALSGLVSLGYQSVWFSVFADRFGATGFTFALVVGGFVGGLATGALASRRLGAALAARLGTDDGLRVYGVLELAVATSALIVPATGWLPTLGWPYEASDGVLVPTLGARLVETLVAAVGVLLPCFLMGTTFPLLCRAHADDERFPAALYGWNALGACAGVLATQLVLLPQLGRDPAYALLVAVNVGIGAVFVLIGSGAARRDGAPLAVGAAGVAPPGTAVSSSHGDDRAPGSGDSETGSPASFAPATHGPDGVLDGRTLLTGAVLAGLATGVLEGDAYKRLAFFATGSAATMAFVSFWAVAGIATGSAVVHAARGLRLVHLEIAWVLALLLSLAVTAGAYPLRALLIDAAYAGVEGGPDAWQGDALRAFPTSPWQALAYSGLFVFPPFVLVSLLLPWLCNRCQADRRHVGVVVGLDTLAFCAGLAAFTWIAPSVDVFYSLKLAPAALALVTVTFLALSRRAPPAALLPSAALALAALCVLVPSGFDADVVHPDGLAARHPVRALRSNAAHTTYVVEAPVGDVLFFDNHPMSGTGFDAQLYMRLMAHVPLLLHEHPRTALLIGFGVGNTAAAIAAHDTVEQIDVVELNAPVLETAPELSRTHGDVHLDPRVRWILDDGRRFLQVSDRTYDLVTTEPPPPLQTGVHRLYSEEFYEQVRARLSPAGLVSQWLPLNQLSEEAVERLVATFLATFPHALLMTGFEREYLLVGSPAPLEIARLERRFHDGERVVDDLRTLDIRAPVGLLARVVLDEERLHQHYGDADTISDRRAGLTFLLPEPGRRPMVPYDPGGWLRTLRSLELASAPVLERTLTHLGRVRHVARMPYEALAQVEAGDVPVALVDIDWRSIAWRAAAADRARQAGDDEAALELLDSALALEPELPELVIRRLRLLLESSRLDEAAAAARDLAALSPEEPLAHEALGRALVGQRRFTEALPPLERARDLDPRSPHVRDLLGVVLWSQGRIDEAIAAFEEALRLAPDHPSARQNLAAIRAANDEG